MAEMSIASAAARDRYDAVAVALHWTTAALVLLLVVTGVVFASGAEGPWKNPLYAAHKATGLLVLLITLVRLAWRLARGVPPLPASVAPPVRRAARLGHLTMYAVLLALPVAGYVYVVAGGYPVEVLNWLGVEPLLEKNKELSKAAEFLHRRLAWVLIALVVGHAAVVAWHDRVQGDGIFRRMAPWRTGS